MKKKLSLVLVGCSQPKVDVDSSTPAEVTQQAPETEGVEDSQETAKDYKKPERTVVLLKSYSDQRSFFLYTGSYHYHHYRTQWMWQIHITQSLK